MSYYDILGVPKTATEEEIKAAYRAQIKFFHPDVFTGPPEVGKIKTLELNEAYSTLKDPGSRQAYNASLWRETSHRAPPPPPPPEPSKAEPSVKPKESKNSGLKYCIWAIIVLFVIAVASQLGGNSIPSRTPYHSSGTPDAPPSDFAEWSKQARAQESPSNSPSVSPRRDIYILTGRSEGYGGVVTATVTTINGEVTAVKFSGIYETPALGGAALEPMAAAIKEKGGTDGVDTVSGATVTSNACIAAANNALDPKKFPDRPSSEAPTPSPQPLPAPSNGHIFYENGAERVAPLTIETLGSSYYIKLRDQKSGDLVLSFFVRGAGSIEIDVPLGSFELSYATGSEWYGESLLFGNSTSYYKADDIFDFTEDDNTVYGWTVELYKQTNGNLDTITIFEDDF